jgi:hypothetical protein
MPLTGTFLYSVEDDVQAALTKKKIVKINVPISVIRFMLINTSTIARTFAARARLKARGEFKSRSSDRLDEIDAYRLYFIEQRLVNKIMDVSIREYQIFFLWLVQSHAQSGPASTSLQEYPD